MSKQKGDRMAIYTVDKDEMKKTCAEIIDFAFEHKPRAIEFNVRASMDEIPTFDLRVEGIIPPPERKEETTLDDEFKEIEKEIMNG